MKNSLEKLQADISRLVDDSCNECCFCVHYDKQTYEPPCLKCEDRSEFEYKKNSLLKRAVEKEEYILKNYITNRSLS